VPPAANLAGAPAPVRWQQHLPWLVLVFVLIALAAAMPPLVRKWQADQALSQLARTAALPAAAPAAGPNPALSASTTTSAEAPTIAAAPVDASQPLPDVVAAGVAGHQAATEAAGQGPGLTGILDHDKSVPATSSQVAATTPAQSKESTSAGIEADTSKAMAGHDAAATQERGNATRGSTERSANGNAANAKAAGIQSPKRERTAAATQRSKPQERTVVEKSAGKRVIRDSGTFKRCPPLGREGAVMCRWHICNGGAGKEAACRPYLERRP
jgi:hypothetical protein